MPIFDIYCRQSGDETEASPELQEASCREFAATHGIEVGAVVIEANTSSILPADERGLGYLLNRCETGESQGILCRHLDRFGRSVAEGALAYKRIARAGARLVAVADGLDSARDGAKLQFTMLMAFAEQVYDRNRSWYLAGKERAVARGVYGAPAPFGYDRDADGRLQPGADADLVRQVFRLRAEGVGFSEIQRQLGVLTRSGMRRIVMNRAYLGEQRIPDPNRPGEPKVVRDSHAPIVTEAEWEAANAVRGRAPIRRGLSEGARLKGLVRCGVCGQPMSILSYGKDRARITYACTRPRCGSASMAVAKIEPTVLAAVHEAVNANEPHVTAVLANDDRYERALQQVTDAQRALAEYRDNIELQQLLGIRDFAAGLRARREAVEVARRALGDTPRPAGRADAVREFNADALGEEFRAYEAALARRVVAEVLVFPKSAEARLLLRWHGAERPAALPAA